MAIEVTENEARRSFHELVEAAGEHRQVYRIGDANRGVVLLSQEEYEGLLETLELLSIPGLGESLQRSLQQMSNADTVSMDQALDVRD